MSQEHPEDNWVWSPQGGVNMHRPELWGEVLFEGQSKRLMRGTPRMPPGR